MITAQDHIDILTLYARYNHLADGEDPTSYSDCYSVEGTLTVGGRVMGAGRTQIAEFRRAQMAIVKKRDMHRRHVATDILLNDHGGTVVDGKCYLQSFLVQEPNIVEMT